MSAELTPRQFAVKAIHEDRLNVKNPSILAKLLKEYGESLLSKKLKEQREICAHVLKYSGVNPGRDHQIYLVTNAPEPKI